VIRRFVIVGLAALLATSGLIASPATAEVLLSCPPVPTTGLSEGIGWALGGDQEPNGLRHTPAPQEVRYSFIPLSSSCNSGAYLKIGDYWGGDKGLLDRTTTYRSRPLGCPVAWGGGPDYPEDTPILIGGEHRSFLITWHSDGVNPGTASWGITKVKAGASGTEYKFVLRIIEGTYAPPPGKKTKMRFPVTISPYSAFPNWRYSCTDDSDPLEWITLQGSGDVVVTQE
jgi:hypothetical protein